MAPRSAAGVYGPSEEQQPQYPTLNTEAEHSHDKGWDLRVRLHGVITHKAAVKKGKTSNIIFLFCRDVTAVRIYCQQQAVHSVTAVIRTAPAAP